MANVRITAVSYLNTLPFIYGIEQEGEAAAMLRRGELMLSVAPPADGAVRAFEGQADVALIPVAAIPALRKQFLDSQIITDYCIGAAGAVESVALYADSPLQELRTVYLDGHSRTSVMLARILARELWGITPQWVEGADVEQLRLGAGEGFVAIGDKTFGLRQRYRYTYDLATEWATLTGGLPFVFAAWVGITPRGVAFGPVLNRALRYGVEHIPRAVAEAMPLTGNCDFETALRYLTECIRFELDEPKRQALDLFWKKIEL